MLLGTWYGLYFSSELKLVQDNDYIIEVLKVVLNVVFHNNKNYYV